MKNIAIGILLVILASILIEPLIEVINVAREKIILNTALSNSCRSAKDRSLQYTLMRNLDASVDEERFVKYFSEAFENAMGVKRIDQDGYKLTFKPVNPEKYNEFVVSLDFIEKTDAFTSQKTSTVEVEVESTYKFKTKYLKLAESAGRNVDYKLVGERSYVLSIKN